MDKLGPVLFAVALVLAIFVLMAIGWRNRKRNQAGFPDLPEIPTLSEPNFAVAGQYVSTTRAGDWLDRIAVHGLGVRSAAQIEIFPEGVLISRSGAGDLFLAREQIQEVRTESGMAGKFVEKDGLVVLTWQWGEILLDSGFRTRRAEDRTPLLAALQKFTQTTPENTEKNG
ncbi:PH-like domain-containing protein [Renibacterium salmoninarum]|uniref:PH-like domain-containing protein n=1 Tax=Renibacterium salmoninarum TaxID=1646 RepID=UPI0002DD6C50|nr:hypothetical protein [Renibacterium salmoninarum]